MNKLIKKVGAGAIIAFVVAVSFFSGLYVNAERAKLASGDVVNTKSQIANVTDADFDTFWEVWNILDKKFVSSSASTTPNQEKIYGAIKGLVDSFGDPYTEFMTPKESEDFQTELSGSLEGVGMTVGIRDNLITVIAPLKGSPSEKVGIKAGDVIYKISDKDVSNMTITEAISLIRGPKGTQVKVTVFRKGSSDPIDFLITRDVIKVPTVETEKLPGKIFKIKIYEFNATSANLFRDAIKDFYYSKYKKIIIDVRNNPGGYLDSAVDMASWFLPAGRTIVTEDFGDSRAPVVHRSKGYNIFSNDIKMVILVNGGSASASEILAGALNEYGIAKLVGEQTFGKGSVQELVPISKGASLKVTIAKWLTPKGNSISKHGLTPDFVVEPDAEEVKADPEKDFALEKAIEVLNN